MHRANEAQERTLVGVRRVRAMGLDLDAQAQLGVATEVVVPQK